MALGASRSSVLQMVALMGLKLVGIGGAIGLLASFAATKVLAAQLTNVSRFDPLTLVCVVALIAAMLGFGGVAGLSADLAKIFLVVAAVILVAGFLFGRGARVP